MLRILALGLVVLLVAVTPVVADQAEDEAAIRQLLERINVAFNDHDAQGMFALMDQSIELWDGSRKGVAVADYYADLFKRQPTIKSAHLEEIGIVFVTPEIAIYKALRDNTGMVDEEGKRLPQVKWLGAWVLVKRNGKWLSAAFFSRPVEE